MQTKILFLLLGFILFLVSCHQIKTDNNVNPKQISVDFKALASDASIQGSILVYDLNKNSFYANDFNWANTGRIPASTFKIPHSLIALELGIAKDENSVFKWDGAKRAYKIWQQDLTFKQALHYSCVPCYQEIAGIVGVKRMKEFVHKFNYGKMDINANNIDDFWLSGNSKINQFEQIDFLKRLYLSQLPISHRTERIFKHMFITQQTDKYTLRAKTGLAVNGGEYNGWYVGYLETVDNVYFFATNISPKQNHDNSFNNKRKSITIKALNQLGFINQ